MRPAQSMTALVMTSCAQGQMGVLIATLIGTSMTAMPMTSDTIPFRR